MLGRLGETVVGEVRRHPELLNEACVLRAELPTRSSAQIAAILFARYRIRVAERTTNGGLVVYRWDIRLQGERETVFFDA